MERQQLASPGIEIAGTIYLSAVDVAKHVGVSRTTLWRWRHEGKIPLGRRYRNGLLLFTSAEVEMVRSYADKVEPVTVINSDRSRLERGSGRRP